MCVIQYPCTWCFVLCGLISRNWGWRMLKDRRGGRLNRSVKTKFTIYVDGFKTLSYQIVSCWDTGQRGMPLYLRMCVLGKYRNDIFACV
jgi:hypothetical protein